MAIRSSTSDHEGRWEEFNYKELYDEGEDDVDDVEDEALSLSDLPMINNSSKDRDQENHTFIKYDHKPIRATETEDDDDQFDFGSNNWSGFNLAQPQMCAADELFFQGQILPVRLSFSSENSSTGFRQESKNLINGRSALSRSESMEYVSSFSRFRSINSSGSSSSSNSVSDHLMKYSLNTNKHCYSRPRIANPFHSHPSPRPQIRVSTNSLQGSLMNRNPTRKHPSSSSATTTPSTSTWVDVFRLGLIKPAGIEPHNRKNHNNSSSSSNNNKNTNRRKSASCDGGSGKSSSNMSNKRIFVPKNFNSNMMPKISMERVRSNSGILLGGVSCKCSVETVPPKIVIKSSTSTKSGSNNSKNHNESERAHAVREKVLLELKMKTQQKQMQKKKKQETKQALSRHRTFEWLKDLSHASFDHHSDHDDREMTA